MPSHKSSIKRVRQTVRKNARNRSIRTSVHALTKDVENVLVKGDVKQAAVSLRKAESAMASAAGKNKIHWKTAARKTSRLAQRVKKAALAAK